MTADPQLLVSRIQTGDAQALAQYIDLHRRQLQSHIASRIGTALQKKVEADDILQDVAMEAVRRISELKGLERDPFGWLCQIAEYRLVDAHRRFFSAEKRDSRREVGLHAPASASRAFIDFLAASMTTASQAFSRNEREIALQAAMESLPPEGQQALRLRYVEGLPSKEIAQRLGKSDGAIRVLLTRSVQRLQQLLGEN